MGNKTTDFLPVKKLGICRHYMRTMKLFTVQQCELQCRKKGTLQLILNRGDIPIYYRAWKGRKSDSIQK